MGRSPCCDKTKVKRGTWSPEEDATLKNYIHNHGNIGGSWISLPLRAGLQRCGKSCRLRWLNYLRPDIKHGGFTSDEEYIICHLYGKIGSRWSVIASHLRGRTDNDVKNYWNTKLKKKMITPNTNKRNMETAATTAATSGAATSSQITPTNVVALQEPVPFQLDASSVSNEPTNYNNFPTFLVEGSSGNNMNFPFCPSLQDSSHLSPFCFDNGVKMDEVLSGNWW